MVRVGRGFVILCLSAALMTTPTVATASAPAAAPSTTNPWLTLGALSTSGAIPMGSAAVVAAQPADMVPPPPPRRAIAGTPPVPIMVFWLGVVATMIYIASQNGHQHVQPNSPA